MTNAAERMKYANLWHGKMTKFVIQLEGMHDKSFAQIMLVLNHAMHSLKIKTCIFVLLYSYVESVNKLSIYLSKTW